MNTLNKLFICSCLAVLAIVCLNSCTKSNPSPSSSSSSAVITGGTWTFTAGYESSNISTQGSSFPITSTSTLTFNTNGTYSSVAQDFTQIGMPGSGINDAGTYSRPDSLNVTSSGSGHYYHAKILKLDANDLWLRYQVYWGDYYELHFTR